MKTAMDLYLAFKDKPEGQLPYELWPAHDIEYQIKELIELTDWTRKEIKEGDNVPADMHHHLRELEQCVEICKPMLDKLDGRTTGMILVKHMPLTPEQQALFADLPNIDKWVGQEPIEYFAGRTDADRAEGFFNGLAISQTQEVS